MLNDVKNTLSVVTQILANDVLPYFDIHKELSASDISAITSQFLTVQTALIQCDQTLEATVLAVEQKINDFNASSGGSSASVTGAYKALKVSSTGLDANVTVTCDELVLSSTSGYKTLKNINLTFNALDTGAITASTWYAVHIAYNGTTAIGILSLSSTAPTLPAGYTFFARVGWIRTDATANKYPLPIIQNGNKVHYKLVANGALGGLPLMASGTLGNILISAPTWVAVSVSAFVPPTASTIYANGFSPNNGAFILAPNNLYGGWYNTTKSAPHYGNISYGGVNASLMLESTNIYIACSVACYLYCQGWEDNI